MYQNRHSRRRLRARKKLQTIDLASAAAKRKSALTAQKFLTGRAGDLALLHGRGVELFDPPVYRVWRMRRNPVSTKGTKSQKPGTGSVRLLSRHRCHRLGRYL